MMMMDCFYIYETYTNHYSVKTQTKKNKCWQGNKRALKSILEFL